MSTGLALQTVTNALRNRLRTAVADQRVETRPPDRLEPGLATSAFLNLFLFEVLPNPAWRNQEYPARGGGALLRPPLPLDLRYLLTAYPAEGEDEGTAHGLLGQAMLLLHDDPVLSRAELRAAMAVGQPRTAVDVQFEHLRVCLMHLPLDELSTLWTAFGTDFRLSVVYQLSVVLIDPGTPATAPLPVLQRGSADPAADEAPTVGVGPGPVLDGVAVAAWLPQRSVPARHLDTIVLDGQGLGSTTFVRFHHPDLPIPLDALAASVSARQVTAEVPAGVPVGFPAVAVGTDLGEGRALTSNRLPLGLAPRIAVAAVAAGDPDPFPLPPGRVRVQITVTPAPAEPVPVVVLTGGAQLPGRRTASGVYRVDVAVPPGATAANRVSVPVRVRIEGIDSVPLPDPVDGDPPPVDWDPAQVVSLP